MNTDLNLKYINRSTHELETALNRLKEILPRIERINDASFDSETEKTEIINKIKTGIFELETVLKTRSFTPTIPKNRFLYLPTGSNDKINFLEIFYCRSLEKDLNENFRLELVGKNNRIPLGNSLFHDVELQNKLERYIIKSATLLKHFLGLVSLYTDFINKNNIDQNNFGKSNYCFYWTPKNHLTALGYKKNKGTFSKKLINESFELLELMDRLVFRLRHKLTGEFIDFKFLTIDVKPLTKKLNTVFQLKFSDWFDPQLYQKIPTQFLEFDSRRERVELLLGIKFYSELRLSKNRLREYRLKTLLDFLGMDDPKNSGRDRKRVLNALTTLKTKNLLDHSIDETDGKNPLITVRLFQRPEPKMPYQLAGNKFPRIAKTTI